MGAKTGLLVYADGDVGGILRSAPAPDPEATAALIARLYPGWTVRKEEPSSLGDGCYPARGTTYATSVPGLDIIGDQRFMLDLPSELPVRLVEASAGRRLVLHAMHSVVDWLAFAVWEDGRLVRSLSLSPDEGVMENIGEPFPFEVPYWAGRHPVPHDPAWSEEPYALPFHPLDLGEEVLRELLGFVLEGEIRPDDADPNDVGLLGFRLTDPDDPDEVARYEAELAEAVARMEPPRLFTFGSDGELIEIEAGD
ncbi:DUF6928 family protein [Actinomadura verrucosospora]|uniref:Uncharacterized protein n=1 Tax=Actinomadura verrucosospora TaxID=46165 RepID=A0A7D4A787_ACTVE|nr:hypothetical protein [Actinomadura verrucosospora]QKG24245.1 hypothetical protein ACTIVE_5888 [Actinomadura verrucosospora]